MIEWGMYLRRAHEEWKRGNGLADGVLSPDLNNSTTVVWKRDVVHGGQLPLSVMVKDNMGYSIIHWNWNVYKHTHLPPTKTGVRLHSDCWDCWASDYNQGFETATPQENGYALNLQAGDWKMGYYTQVEHKGRPGIDRSLMKVDMEELSEGF